jgi:hypothetical protein
MPEGQEMTREQKIEAIARTCHEANKGWCEAHGDFSQATWGLAEQWQRDSAVKGVEVALATSEQQHEAWAADKVADGWTYGPVKDAANKTHPCLVDYHLPAMQRAKDGLFRATVRALAPALGLTSDGARLQLYLVSGDEIDVDAELTGIENHDPSSRFMAFTRLDGGRVAVAWEHVAAADELS